MRVCDSFLAKGRYDNRQTVHNLGGELSSPNSSHDVGSNPTHSGMCDSQPGHGE
jgi:hypothetical protein